LNALGFQLLASIVQDPKLGVLGPQLLVLKAKTHELLAIHLLLEKKKIS
jgi:hypothetical protein